MTRRIRMTSKASESGYQFLRNGPVDVPPANGGSSNDVRSIQAEVQGGRQMDDDDEGLVRGDQLVENSCKLD